MALAVGTTVEIRTTGNDSNGGGFTPGATGTDYSQQNAAQYSFTDLASANGTTNPSVVTSASHSFVAADVGNLMQISAGTSWTTGFYRIVSVSAGAATLDRAVGSVAALSGGTYAVGGALATLSKAWSMGANSSQSNNLCLIFYIKVGTYTITTPIVQSGGSVAIIGYDVTRGDDTGNRPLITTATNSIDLVQLHNATQWDNINFSSTAVTPGDGVVCPSGSNQDIMMRRCKFTGFSTGINASQSGNYNIVNNFVLLGVEVGNCTSTGIHLNMFGCMGLVYGCYVHNNGGQGMYCQGTNQAHEEVVLVDSIFDHNTSHGLQSGTPDIQSLRAYNCNFTNNGGDGINYNNLLNPGSDFQNCIFYGNGNWGLNMNGSDAPSNVYLSYCAFGSNSSGVMTGVNSPQLVLGSITLTANPFNSTTDFSLNSAAGGGALLKQNSFPTAFGSGTVNKRDIGAVQSGSAAAPGPKPRAHWG